MSEKLSDDGIRDILSDDDAWVTRGEIQEMARELVELRALCGEVYQVVGVLAHQADVFSTPEVDRAMNNLVAAINGSPLPHETLLPFGVRAAGPVMPEVPSDDLILRVLAGSSLPGAELILRGMYDAIRSALMQEQSGASETPKIPA